MRLIDIQDVIDAVDEQIKYCDKALASFDISLKDEYAVKVEKASLNVLKKTLEYLPPAEPERKTGHWIYHDDGFEDYYECSECGRMRDEPHPFCEECGAKMGGGA